MAASAVVGGLVQGYQNKKAEEQLAEAANAVSAQMGLALDDVYRMIGYNPSTGEINMQQLEAITTNAPDLDAQVDYGAFTAPTAEEAMQSPGTQFALEQANAALADSLGSQGYMGTGSGAREIARYNTALANGLYGDVYNRELSAYQANRDTNNQNFNQRLAQWQANYGQQLNNAQMQNSVNMANQQAVENRLNTAAGARMSAAGATAQAQGQAATTAATLPNAMTTGINMGLGVGNMVQTGINNANNYDLQKQQLALKAKQLGIA
jgi:hypothetical protein